jgi:hypothetical protein
MGPIGCPETSVTNYHNTLRNIPEERRSHMYKMFRLKMNFPISYVRLKVSFLTLLQTITYLNKLQGLCLFLFE